MIFLPTFIGFSSILVQIILLREFFSLFSGNEFTIGIIIGNWLLLTAIGAYLGRLKTKNINITLTLSHTILALSPIIALAFLRFVFPHIFIFKEDLSLINSFLLSFLILAPYCMTMGFILVKYCDNFPIFKIEYLYSLDNIGSIIGGILFSFLFIYILNSISIFLILFVLNLFCINILIAKKISQKSIVLISVLIIIFSVLGQNLEKFSLEGLYKEEITTVSNSSYSNLVLTKNKNQFNLYSNHMPLYTIPDRERIEEKIHFPLLQINNAGKVLFLSGYVFDSISELKKYGIQRADYVELDRKILDLVNKELGPKLLEGLNVINEDPRTYLTITKEKYDLVILDMPPPETITLNRFYTLEFFQNIKKILNNNGVFFTRIGKTQNYYPKETRELISTEVKTIEKVFGNTLLIPSNNLYLLASDKVLEKDYSKLIDSKGIQSDFVNQDHLKGIFEKTRVESIDKIIDRSIMVNSDNYPVSSFYIFLNWINKTGSEHFFLFLILISIISATLFFRENIAQTVFINGFTCSALSVSILVFYQFKFGVLYGEIGLLFSSLILGLTIGAYFGSKIPDRKINNIFIYSQFFLALFCFILPSLIDSSFLSKTILICLNFVIGLTSGVLFVLASYLQPNPDSKTSITLNSDYFGGALGALLFSSIIISVLGITNSIYLISFFNFLNVLLLFCLKSKKTLIPLFMTLIMILFFIFAQSPSSEIVDRFSKSINYQNILLSLLFIFLILAILNLDHFFKKQIFHVLSFFVFGIVLFIPVIKCFFKIPYLFCHTCPEKCIFGLIRPYIIPSALLLNLSNGRWCSHLCPIALIRPEKHFIKVTESKIIRNIMKYSILFFVIFTYFYLRAEQKSNTLIYLSIFKGLQNISPSVIATFLFLFIASLLFRNYWCSHICPINSISGMILKIISKKRKLKNNN